MSQSSSIASPRRSPASEGRCPWAEAELQHEYHDTEWGVPSHDDRHLFEMIILEGAQAGLSWSTILKKRPNYRAAYRNFDVARIARFTTKDEARLLADPGIVRNRLKVAASVLSARAFISVQEEFGSFDAYLWRFVNGRPIQHNLRKHTQIPVRTAESDALSEDLKERGFKFVGTTICYAFMQATGMVNDHLLSCPRHAACAKLR